MWHEIPHGTLPGTIADVLAQEQAALMPLPAAFVRLQLVPVMPETADAIHEAMSAADDEFDAFEPKRVVASSVHARVRI